MTPGVLLPLGALPDAAERVALFLPTGPLAEVLRLGWLGHQPGDPSLTFAGSTLAALPPLAVLLCWLLIALATTRRWFRWEPRHA